ncbi:hypothetical protein LINPERPRIM_LOCUS1014 [Linum perenne]
MIAFAVIPTIGSNVMNVNKVVQARKGGISMALALAMISYIFRLIPDLSLHGADGWHPGLGLFVTIRRNGKLSSFSCSGNLTSIWLSCDMTCLLGVHVFKLNHSQVCCNPLGYYLSAYISIYNLIHLCTFLTILTGSFSGTVSAVIHEITTAKGISCFRVLVVENGSKNFSGQQLKLLDDDDR